MTKKIFTVTNFILFVFILILVSVGYAADQNLDINGNVLPLSEIIKNAQDYNQQIPKTVTVIKNIGEGFTYVLKQFQQAMISGTGYLKEVSVYFAIVLGLLDVTIPICVSGMSVSFNFVIPKIMKLGIILAIINYWTRIVNEFFIPFVEHCTQATTGDLELASATLTQPQIILQKCIEFLTPAMNYITEEGYFTFPLIVKGSVIFLQILVWYTLFIYIKISLKILLIYLQFYVCAMFNVFAIPFAQIKFLKRLTENLSGGMVTSTINLITTLFLVHCSFLVLKNYSAESIFKGHSLSLDGMMTLVGLCFALIGMARLIEKIPKETSQILGGTLELD